MSLGMKSARRRHHAMRILKRKERMTLSWGESWSDEDRLEWARHFLAMRGICSCPICNDSRKVHGMNAQEARERGRLIASMEAID